jgi:PEP-CTERM motif
MKFGYGSIFLALMLSTATAALADGIHKGRLDGGEEFVLKSDHVNVKDGISDGNGLKGFGSSSGEGQIKLNDLGFNHGDSGKKDLEKSGLKDTNEGDLDGASNLSVVAVPEPRTQTLLLFGLAALGMSLYRRNGLKVAI